MGERSVRIRKAVGSNPIISTQYNRFNFGRHGFKILNFSLANKKPINLILIVDRRLHITFKLIKQD